MRGRYRLRLDGLNNYTSSCVIDQRLDASHVVVRSSADVANQRGEGCLVLGVGRHGERTIVLPWKALVKLTRPVFCFPPLVG